MVYALSLTGNKDTKNVTKIYTIRNKAKLNDYSRALLVLALKNHGLDKEAAKAAAELAKSAKKAPGGRLYWGSRDDYWWWNDGIETTAQVVRALAAVNPDSKLLYPAVKWLAINRINGNAWRSTRDTAAAILALLDYAKATGDGSASVTANVSLNGGKKMSRSFSAKDAFAQPWVMTFDGGDLRAKNALGISKSGSGRLYITVTKTWYDAESPIPPQDNGVRVYGHTRK